MQPITFEDAREEMIWEGIEQGLRAATRIAKEYKRQEVIKKHQHWECHWRTRLSNWLRLFANKIELPEPPLPQDKFQ